MKYGISIINFAWFGDIDLMVEVAVEAEESGWDGFFLWDHLLMFKDKPVYAFLDPWIALTAIACHTKKMRLGPLVTPVPRRRPWKLARETVTLDHLSKGRLILGVGLGSPPDVDFAAFGEESNAKIRAEKLDEGLQILNGLWSGKPFSHDGKHYQLDEMTFIPKPRQDPRIPIWVGGSWPYKAPFKRAARYDGVVPTHSGWPKPFELSHLEDVLEIVRSERGNLSNFDIAVLGETTGTDSSKDCDKLEPWVKAGATWWLEEIHGIRAGLDELRERIRAGPPAA